MVIDLINETVLPLAEIAERLPKCRNGKPPHYSTVSRWASRGIDGVKLETIVVGATTCSTMEAVQDFCQRRTNPTTPKSRTSRARQKAIAEADRVLEEAGVS